MADSVIDFGASLRAACEGLEPAAGAISGCLDEKTALSIAISLRRIADMMAADRAPRPASIASGWPDAPLPEGEMP